ncbi:MAG: hypothetical protein ABI855_18330 [Bacteroidota bacterium]
MNPFCVVPECYAETRVVEILLQLDDELNHQHGVGNVIRAFEKRLHKYIAVGIIDEDPNKGSKPSKLSDYQSKKSNASNTLELFKHRDRFNYIIKIKPEIEKFLINASKESNINPVDFNLPADFLGLSQITKSKNIKNNKDFTQCIKAMINANAPSLSDLKNWIEEIFNQ